MKTLYNYLAQAFFFRSRSTATIFIIILFGSTSVFSQCWESITAGGGTVHAILLDGTLWGWGQNSGHLGIGFTPAISFTSTAVQIGTDADWLAVSDGDTHAMALKTDGTLWCWGDNNYGAVGDGTAIWRWEPVQIGSDNDWQSISAGSDLSIALKTDGTMWTWGGNNYGQLGDNSNITKYSPTQIGTFATWVIVQTGGANCGAIKSDGTLWVWGGNRFGQVGDGTLDDKLVPTQIGTENNWQYLKIGFNHCAAQKTDSSLWLWGGNSSGQLGTVSSIVPTELVSDSSWSSIALGYFYTLAVKSNGTLWSWGYNASAQLGLGNMTETHFPTQIGTATNWQSVETAIASSFALTTDDTLYSWGYNYYGELGNGMSGNFYSTPVNVNCSALSVPEKVVDRLTVFPNPTNDVVYFRNLENTLFNIQVLDSRGREILQSNSTNSVDISRLSSGIYFLKIVQPETFQTITRKIIKQ